VSKSIVYEIECNEDGAYTLIPVTITFIPNGRIKEFNELDRLTKEMTYEVAKFRVAELKFNAIDNATQEQVAEYEAEAKRIIKMSESKPYSDIPSRRFALIRKILMQNGIVDGKLHDRDYWDDCIDCEIEYDFLNVAVHKDLDKKKIR
jgi:hypothetical protein